MAVNNIYQNMNYSSLRNVFVAFFAALLLLSPQVATAVVVRADAPLVLATSSVPMRGGKVGAGASGAVTSLFFANEGRRSSGEAPSHKRRRGIPSPHP